MSLAAKIGKYFNTIGYSRAARELRRAGYVKEANNCIKMMHSL